MLKVIKMIKAIIMIEEAQIYIKIKYRKLCFCHNYNVVRKSMDYCMNILGRWDIMGGEET